MCLLTFFPDGMLPDSAALLTGAEYNDDGHGFAIVVRDHPDRGDFIIRGHGLDWPSVVSRFERLRAAYPEGPALFHSRIGTSGHRSSRWNCHPFDCDKRGQTVLAHNGILPKRVQPKIGDMRSDTAVLAEDYWPDHPVFSRLDEPSALRDFEVWLGMANKVAILTVNPAYLENAYLLNEQHGSWHRGVWYSNDSYKGYTYYTSSGWSGGVVYRAAATPRTVSTGDGTVLGPTPTPAATGAAAGPKSAQESAAVFSEQESSSVESYRSATLDTDCPACQGMLCVDPLSGICRFCQSCRRCGDDFNDCVCDLTGPEINARLDARVAATIDAIKDSGATQEEAESLAAEFLAVESGQPETQSATASAAAECEVTS